MTDLAKNDATDIDAAIRLANYVQNINRNVEIYRAYTVYLHGVLGKAGVPYLTSREWHRDYSQEYPL